MAATGGDPRRTPGPAVPKPGPVKPAQQWFQERPSPCSWEQDALDHVRRLMPAAEPYRAWATFSFTAQSGRVNECDLLIAVPPGFGSAGSYELTRAERRVLLGEDPPVNMTGRAVSTLRRTREEYLERVHPGGTLIVQDTAGQMRWWTWAGHRANATLAATLDTVAVPGQHINDRWIRLREDVTVHTWGDVTKDATDRLCLPDVDERAVRGLKFGEALPPRLAEATLSARLADTESAAAVLTEPVRFVRHER
ncbi:hypothetical protein [Streptomyces neyagawaensis]|uniref:hypothetical protein n=1 Tax=Streptomyces neyagawaensis TaxID=42238 RepID=UPI000AA9B983|nr:hypothetical protein [Streptomyces neyagawaensis]MCL6731328.1 hypothetical protein [Streptomyces neyagawaensis]MDE1683548.1 hypothetical protein [Streptomyces neyagawaensis]